MEASFVMLPNTPPVFASTQVNAKRPQQRQERLNEYSRAKNSNVVGGGGGGTFPPNNLCSLVAAESHLHQSNVPPLYPAPPSYYRWLIDICAKGGKVVVGDNGVCGGCLRLVEEGIEGRRI
eukprot:CAMPEP_0118649770 /NCGR_PEP_ID=MMETSP0785-20121206/9883_1 /TAXON_ID=91992 /ORGANISM="Bolidomonas pacifica, Strain CCMP 1866" /LENGTH=120 /DNA_ID=CAMNT_0006542085 /DNA_START=950 /DNA_END=1309 /DNA_ORIENTATION=+